MNLGKIEKGVKLILEGLGVDERDPNFLNTPERVAKAYSEIFVPDDTEWATFPERYNDFIMLRDHEVVTLCPHHLLPVTMRTSIAYIPDGQVLGLSKLARLLHEVNDGPMLQEKFTEEIVHEVAKICQAKGAAAHVVAEHGCMRHRGVKTTGDVMTYKLTGEFERDDKLADRFFRLVTMK